MVKNPLILGATKRIPESKRYQTTIYLSNTVVNNVFALTYSEDAWKSKLFAQIIINNYKLFQLPAL